MSRFEMVVCDFVFSDGDTCGLRTATRLADGWLLGDTDLCPRHKPRGGGNGGGTPIPLPVAA